MSVLATPKPGPCNVRPENIPPEMKARPQWVCWRWTWTAPTQKAAAKWDKPPLNSRTGEYASSTNPDSWSPFKVALAAYLGAGNGLDGVGCVFSGAPDDFVGVDLDDCRDPLTGEIRPWTAEQRACQHWAEEAPDPQQIIISLASYAEVSPSQTGVKLIVRGTIPKGLKHGDIEMYRRGRYFTITGLALDKGSSAFVFS